MKQLKFIMLLSVIIIISSFGCNNKGKTIKFNGILFDLPMSIDLANEKFKLDAFFRNGNINNRKVFAHKKDDNTIEGMTFYKKCATKNKLEILRNDFFSYFEKKYKSHFKSIVFSFFTSIDGNYYYMELEDGLIIVLGDVMYNAADNNYVTVSFFKGIAVKDLTKYLGNIY